MITVITPFKNAENWLGRYLESMTKQKGDFQFVIVDDHSEDIGRTIAEDYAKADFRFEVYSNEHANGVSGARNTGLDHAKGEWITFLDADDEFDDDAWRNFKKSLGIDADIHQFNHLRYYPKIDATRMKYSNCEGWYDIEHLPTFWCMVWNKIYRREKFKSVRFVEGLQYGEDEIYNLECFEISDQIYQRRDVGIVHRFDNADSLSKVKGAEGLISQQHALEDLLFRTKDAKTRRAILNVITEHWSSQTFLRVFGEENIEYQRWI